MKSEVTLILASLCKLAFSSFLPMTEPRYTCTGTVSRGTPKQMIPDTPSHQIRIPTTVEYTTGITSIPNSQNIFTSIMLKSFDSIFESLPTSYLLMVYCERPMIFWNTIEIRHERTLLKISVAS